MLKFDYIMRDRDSGKLYHEELTLEDVETYFAVEFVEIIARRAFTEKYARGKKPIYQGDIIKSGPSDGFNGIGEIVFEDSAFRIKWHDPRYISIRGERPEHLFANSEIAWTIIGNIYENSNLLIK